MKCILEKNIKPLCCSSLILKQIICKRISKAEQKSRFIFRDVTEQKHRVTVAIYANFYIWIHASQPSRHMGSTPRKITRDPNKRDLYSVVFGSSLSTPMLICVRQINFCSKQFKHVLLNNLWIQDTLFFFIRIYFIRISRLKFAKF